MGRVKKILKYLGFFLAFLLLLSICLIDKIDRKSYKDLSFYQLMNSRLDSLQNNYKPDQFADSMNVGVARISITPETIGPLAGYGARQPMEFDQVLDSVFVRAIVLDNGKERKAILSADLLIIHPEISGSLFQKLAEKGWNQNDIYLGATHSHSSVGGWAPGFAGELFSGDYNQFIGPWIVDQMVKAIDDASNSLKPASIGYINNELGENVKNRLMKGGEEDAWMRNLFFKTDKGIIDLTTYAAHATCFSKESHSLTGDFPSYFHGALSMDSAVIFTSFLAGAVASMGPEMDGRREQEGARYIGENMAEQISLLVNLGTQYDPLTSLSSFRLKVPLRSPQVKVSKNLKIRPWLFDRLLGNYQVDIEVLKMNNTIMIGMPCDFSGELALPLYEYARAKGLNLIITSFNGGYIGYVTQDDRYDLEKYETRTMNWYGPDSGAYFSEIVRRIIDTIAQ